MQNSRLIPLGVIGAPHGIRGQVKIRSFTADPEDITSYGPLCDKTGKTYNITVTGKTKDALIATIAGITTPEDAQKFRNIELCVPRSALPKPKKNVYYYEDLAGLAVLTQDGQPFGTIMAVHNYGAGDLVEVKLTNAKEELFPFTKAIFPEIDVEKGTAVILPPEVVSHE